MFDFKNKSFNHRINKNDQSSSSYYYPRYRKFMNFKHKKLTNNVIQIGTVKQTSKDTSVDIYCSTNAISLGILDTNVIHITKILYNYDIESKKFVHIIFPYIFLFLMNIFNLFG